MRVCVCVHVKVCVRDRIQFHSGKVKELSCIHPPSSSPFPFFLFLSLLPMPLSTLHTLKKGLMQYVGAYDHGECGCARGTMYCVCDV